MFIHKVDGLPDDQRSEVLKDITARTNEDLREAGVDVYLNTQLTSVYNHSILDAVSKVSQKLIPEVSVALLIVVLIIISKNYR